MWTDTGTSGAEIHPDVARAAQPAIDSLAERVESTLAWLSAVLRVDGPEPIDGRGADRVGERPDDGQHVGPGADHAVTPPPVRAVLRHTADRLDEIGAALLAIERAEGPGRQRLR